MEYQPVKIVYLVERKPGFTREQFIQRWRQHGALGMSMARWVNVAKYAHCDVSGEVGPGGQVMEPKYDGIGMSWFWSAAHRAAHTRDTEAQARMVEDERQTFSDLVGKSRAICQEEVLFGEDSTPGAKVVRLISRRPDLSAAEFASLWSEYAPRFAAENRGRFTRYSIDNIIDPALPDSRLACDVIDELAFDSPEQLRSYCRADLRDLELRDPGQRAFATAYALVTNEVVLHDVRPEAAARTG